MIELVKKQASINLTTISQKDITKIYDEGYGDGYTTGKEEGYSNGKEDGYTEGYTSGYATGAHEGYEEGFNEGYESGVIDTTEEFNNKYAVGTIQGNDSISLTIPCAFEPDAVYLQTLHPLYRNTSCVHLWQVDFRSFGQHSGNLRFANATSILNSSVSTNTIKKFVVYEDGAITLNVPSSSSTAGVIYEAQILYNYAFVKYTDKDDYTLLVEQVEALDNTSGTITYNEARVKEAIEEAIANGVITNYDNWLDVWEVEIIALKPAKTFSLV